MFAHNRWVSQQPQPFSIRPVEAEMATRIMQGGHRVGTSKDEIVLFSRYSCPFCVAIWPQLDSLLKEPHPKFSVKVRHLVRPGDSPSFLAAVATECAAEQEKFREFHSQVLRSWGPLMERDLIDVARETGVGDLDQFKVCMASENAKDRVRADYDLGMEAQITGVPTLLIGDKLVTGSPSPRQIEKMLR